MGLWARLRAWVGKGRISAYWRGDPRAYQRIYVPEHWDRRMGHREPSRFHHGEGGGGGGGGTPHERPAIPWPTNFPPIVPHTTLMKLKLAGLRQGETPDVEGRSPIYLRAKEHADKAAAVEVVGRFANFDALSRLAQMYPGAWLLPMVRREGARRNAIPAMFAAAARTASNLDIDEGIVIAASGRHTKATPFQRLLRRPVFDGSVTKGRTYVLVDDVVNTGAAFAALRSYIEVRGGHVLAAIALVTRSDEPVFRLAMGDETRHNFAGWNVRQLNVVLRQYEIADHWEELSDGQARIVLEQGDVDAFRDRILEERDGRDHRVRDRALPPSVGGPPQVPPKLKKSSFWSLPGYLDERGRVHLGRRPAPPDPPADPPRPRIPFSAPLPPGATRIHIKGTPTAAQALILHHELFPAAGTYLLTKATPMAGLEDREALDQWEEWFLRALEDRAREQFGSSQEAIWDVLDELLRQRGVAAPSMVDAYEMHRVLFDVTYASTARMVGLRLPDEVRTRLEKLGWHDMPVLDFPAVAFRLAMISQRLMQQPPVTWPELVQLADAVPLSSVERAAVDIARSRAGTYLKPIFDDVGRLHAVTRELEPLRQRVAHAIEHRIPVREAARLHGNQQRIEGIQRDAERVLRTEIADARGEAAWMHETKRAPSDAKFFRQTSAHACRGCLRLYKLPDGTPRLYTRAEIDTGHAAGVNRGNWRDWHPRLGSTHPNCFPAGTLVEASLLPRAGFERIYRGDLVTIWDESGHDLSCTPNHPILTDRGWIAAGRLNVGDHIVSGRARDRRVPRGVDCEDVPTRIEQVVHALRLTGGMPPLPVPVAPEDFHGDGKGSEVAVVWPNGLLTDDIDAPIREQCEQHGLRAARNAGMRLSAQGAAAQILLRALHAPHRIMSSRGIRPALFRCFARYLDALLLAGCPQADAAVAQARHDAASAYANGFRNRKNGVAGFESLHDIGNVDILSLNQSQSVLMGPRCDSSAVQRLDYEAARHAHRDCDLTGAVSVAIPRNDCGNIHAPHGRLSPIANYDPSQSKQSSDRRKTNSESTSDGVYTLASEVTADDFIGLRLECVASISRQPFEGIVYNLATHNGAYVANGIVVHNCLCAPWAQFHPEMADIFADRAPTYAAEMERLGVFKQAA